MSKHYDEAKKMADKITNPIYASEIGDISEIKVTFIKGGRKKTYTVTNDFMQEFLPNGFYAALAIADSTTPYNNNFFKETTTENWKKNR